MHLELQFLIRLDFILMSIVSNLLSIHDRSWHFDTTTEVDIVVAEVIGISLNLVLTERGSVMHHNVMNWECCCYCSFMRNQEEVKNFRTILVD